MSLDAIRKSILSEAEAKASAMESEAGKEAQRIVEEAEEKAKEILKNAESDARKEADRMNREARAGAEMEANSMLLEARGEAVERAMRKVLKGAEEELEERGMKKIFDQSIKQFRDVSGGDFKIKTGRKNADLFKGSAYEVEYGDIDGFMLYADRGKVALNATVGSIVARQADSARKLISSKLFGGKEKPATTKRKANAVPKKEARAAKKAKASRKKR
jgi:vacuolar-type H+-ATPase subunit E/Vma4